MYFVWGGLCASEKRQRAAVLDSQDPCCQCGPTAPTSAGLKDYGKTDRGHSPASKFHDVPPLQVSSLTLGRSSLCLLHSSNWLYGCPVLSPTVGMKRNGSRLILNCELVWLIVVILSKKKKIEKKQNKPEDQRFPVHRPLLVSKSIAAVSQRQKH